MEGADKTTARPQPPWTTSANLMRSGIPNFPAADAIGLSGFQGTEWFTYEFASLSRIPSITSATIRPPTGPSRLPLMGARPDSFRT